MPEEPVNCGRCAHLWNRAQPGFGICASRARQDQSGVIRQQVALDATCEHAQLSAKFDPDFLPRLFASRRGEFEKPDPETPATAKEASGISPEIPEKFILST